jgi:hypothetical protein
MWIMDFSPPKQEELIRIFSEIEKEYTGNNPKRKIFNELITLLKERFKEKNYSQFKVFLAAGFLAYKLTKDEPFVLSAHGGLFNHGSSYFKLIEKKFGITKDNPVDDESLIICMAEIYDYLKQHDEKADPKLHEVLTKIAKSYCWEWNANYESSLNKVTAKAIANIYEPLKKLLQRFPVGEKFRHKIAAIEPDYLALKPNGGHKTFARVVSLINHTCDTYSYVPASQPYSPQFASPDEVRNGLMLYAIKKTDGYLSHTYADLCRNAVNHAIKSPTELSDSERYQYLNKLFQHISHYLKFPDQLNIYIRNIMPPHATHAQFDEEKRQMIAEFKKWQTELAAELQVLLPKSIQPPTSNIPQRIGDNVEYVTQFGVNLAVGKSVNRVISPSLNKMAKPVIVIGMAALGAVTFGPLGEIAGATLGGVLGDHISVVLTGMCVSMVEPLGRGIAKTVKAPFTITFKVVENSIKFIYSDDTTTKEIKTIDLAENEEFLLALQKLPNHLFTEAQKNMVGDMLPSEDEKAMSYRFMKA